MSACWYHELNAQILTDINSWDNYYEHDLDCGVGEGSEPIDLAELESWFDDVGAPAKTLAFLTSKAFPLSPNNAEGGRPHASVLDIGAGNGSTLLLLRLAGRYRGPMLGVDYSAQSVSLARKLCNVYVAPKSESETETDAATSSPTGISFEVFDVIRDEPKATNWWPRITGGFDLVLDKGTFDAVCLSSERVRSPTGLEVRLSELYPTKVAALVKPGGFFLITSCNWTQNEVIRRFTTEGMQGILEFYDTINYPTFHFGGQQGQGVVSICFRKVGPT